MKESSVADSDYASDMDTTEHRPDKPCHRECESLFSSKSGFSNYRGLLNDCILLLVLSNARNIIHNLTQYGFLVDPMQWVQQGVKRATWPFWGLLITSWVFPLLALYFEKLMVKKRITERNLVVYHAVNIASLVIFPVVVVFLTRPGPVGSFFSLIWYTVLFMKLISYTQVNWWCRTDKSSKKKDDGPRQKKLVQYPDNLNIKDIVYFCAVPTLCYELNFPRTDRIHKVFVIRRILEAVFILQVQLAIIQQWLIPTALHSLQPFKEMDWAKMVERVFLLALPNHLFWLLGFYWMFHSMMNLTAELLRFADRKFYGDWWNAQDIRRFWKAWNIPVHRWASRHIYNPLIKSGYNKIAAQLIVFAMSAFFHEYLVSVPLHMLRPWAFVAMLGQVPLGTLTSISLFRGQIGNVIVWASIVLGQPIAILMYLHDYYVINWAPHNTTIGDTIPGT